MNSATVTIARPQALFIGHTRFSICSPESLAWHASSERGFGNADDYRAYLYSDKRIGPRMEIFSDHLVPTLAHAAQSHDIHHIVSFSESLPLNFKEHLRALADKHEWLVLDEKPEGEAPLSAAQLSRELVTADGTVFATYRVDDDDLIAWDFFDRAARYVQQPFVGMVVSFGQGLTARYGQRRYWDVRTCYEPMLAIGLLNICQFRDGGWYGPRTRHTHNHSDRSNPVILDSTEPSFMWTRHAEQDTNILWAGGSESETIQRLHDMLMKYDDPAELPILQRKFPTLAGRLTTCSQEDPVADLTLSQPQCEAVQTAPISLPLLRGRVQLRARISIPDTWDGRKSLLCFGFVDEQDRDCQLSANLVRRGGMALSDNPDWGAFIYLPHTAGFHEWEAEIQVPDGFRLATIRVNHRLITRERWGFTDFRVSAGGERET